MQLKDLIQWQKISGQAVVINGFTLTPQSQALIVRLPFAAFVWNLPTALLVERNGQVEHLAIVDVTRTLQLGLVGLSIALTIGSLILFVLKRRRMDHD
jgi:hypothetical protein